MLDLYVKYHSNVHNYLQQNKIPHSSFDEGGEESVVSEDLWDKVEEVTSSFINKGKSREPGMLTTHDMRFKVRFCNM